MDKCIHCDELATGIDGKCAHHSEADLAPFSGLDRRFGEPKCSTVDCWKVAPPGGGLCKKCKPVDPQVLAAIDEMIENHIRHIKALEKSLKGGE